MWIRDVNIPDELVTAQQEGRLLVFAGAGISMDPPSNLPNFKDLAIALAGGGMAAPDEKEPLDRYVGRVKDRGTDIQVRARGIIGNPDSQARAIHHSLCRIFRAPPDIRIVTTNFDRHLTTAFHDAGGEDASIYCAPALPLGSSFSGLVYLHGSVDRPQHPLILSDRDFGKAYLTEGWATRFLHEVFKTYTVLFVGYSHNDVVISYIARSLSPGGSLRFALVDAANDGQWEYLGIVPVRYPVREAPDRHGALDQCLVDWIGRARMGVFDHDRRIRDLVALPPPVAKEDVDYVESVLRDAIKLRFFVDAARGRDWMEWVAKRGFLGKLVSPEQALGECEGILGWWLVHHYAVALPQPLFDFLEERGGRLHAGLWMDLARVIAYGDPKPEKALLAQWVVILIQAADPRWNHTYLDEVLKSCNAPEDGQVALMLWRHLATPRARLAHRWTWGEKEGETPEVRIELTCIGEKHDLQQAWRGYFRGQLDALYPQLTASLIDMLHEAHALQLATGEGDDWWDGASMSRSAIEPHEQDRSLDPIDVLIDAARDLMEWLLANRHETARGIRSQWLESTTPLLRRIGIHALTVDPQFTSNEALVLVLANQWLYQLGVKHEVFQLLKAKYAGANEEIRAQLLDAAEEDALPGDDDDARRTSVYARFNLLLWLHEAAPDCVLTTKRLERVKEQHPNFTRRDYPDLSSWGSGARWVIPHSPISVEDLVGKDPAEAAPWLAAYHEERPDFEGPDRRGLLTAASEAASKHLPWAMQIMQELAARGLWVSDLWGSLLDGLTSAGHSKEQWVAIVTLLDSHPQIIRANSHSALRLLEKLVEADAGSLDLALVGQAMSIAQRSVGGEAHGDTVTTTGRRDWLMRAINHVGGKAAMVTVQGLSKLRELSGDSWEGMPGATREWIESMAQGPNIDAQRARTVFASQLHFFFSLDRAWTITTLVPLFSWNQDALTAEQAWSGFLSWGNWNDAILEALSPSLEASFSHLGTDLAELRDETTRHLAGIALYSTRDPWHDGWLMAFFREADDPTLQAWAWEMGQALRELKEEAVRTTWDRWMRDFWMARATGVPRPFTEAELSAMLVWTLGLQPVLQEVVDLFCRQPVKLPQHSTFLFGLREDPIIETSPALMAKLFDHLLRSSVTLGYECGFAAEIARRLHSVGAGRAILLDIVESLARLSCAEARQLRADIGL